MMITGPIQWSNFIGGLAGGAASTLILHPLDLAKIRLQVNEGTGIVPARLSSGGMFRTLIEIVRVRGFQGLYMGFTPNLIATSGSWGLYFLLYGALKRHMQGSDATKPLHTMAYLSCAALAGSTTLTLMNPFWVLKTQLCLQYERIPSIVSTVQPQATSSTLTPTTMSMKSAMQHILRNQGLPGLYRGYLMGLIGVSHGAIQFMLYDQMQNTYNVRYRKLPSNAKMGAVEYLTFASLSKLVAATVTYPYQVIRSRLQDQHRTYSNIRHVIRELLKWEGLLGFYKGLVPNLLRVTPACAVTFLVYEYTSDWLNFNQNSGSLR